MTSGLINYLLRVFLTTHRCGPPLFVLFMTYSTILATPPMDASSALLASAPQLACTMWLTYLARGMESAAQQAITAARCSSLTAPRLGKVTTAAIIASFVPLTTLLIATALGRVSVDVQLQWWTIIATTTLVGLGVGNLIYALRSQHSGHATVFILLATFAVLIAPGPTPLGILRHHHLQSVTPISALTSLLVATLVSLAALMASQTRESRY